MIRVIGLGSPFGEDRAGWLVADRLQGRLTDEVEVVALDRPGAAVVNWMRDCEHLVLIDAVLAPERRGEFARLAPDDLVHPAPVSGHGIDLAQSLALAYTLGKAPETVEIYGLYISDLENISQAISRAAERLADHLETHLRKTESASAAGNRRPAGDPGSLSRR